MLSTNFSKFITIFSRLHSHSYHHGVPRRNICNFKSIFQRAFPSLLNNLLCSVSTLFEYIEEEYELDRMYNLDSNLGRRMYVCILGF